MTPSPSTPNTNMDNTIVNPTNVACAKCGGYIVPPTYWHGTTPPRMCTCYVQANTGWICSRCGKSNSPYKMSCDCSSSDPLKVTC
jgi:hypothetical protein